jgi:AraC-like DNA-binding protein
LHVVALLPRNLLQHLRLVLGEHHALSAAGDAAALDALLRSADADVLVLDPAMRDGEWQGVLEELLGAHPEVPAIAYTTLTPEAMRRMVRLARAGLQHVVLNRFDDEPSRFLDLIERAPAQPLAEAMLRELAMPLSGLPALVVRAIEQMFRSPARVKSVQELSNQAGMVPRTLQRHLMPVGLQPGQLLMAARLLRVYTLAREPGVQIKAVAKKLSYSDPSHLTEQLREWTGCSLREVRTTHAPDQFVRLLAAHLLRASAEHDVEDAEEPV